MDEKSKPIYQSSVAQDQSHVAGIVNLQGTPQPSGNNMSQMSSGSHKKGHEKENTEVRSHQHYTMQLNSSQSHPKKKGGFVITSVKDSVDGDESADDLDESHASRTTDVDRDEESSTSDETLTSSLQDGVFHSVPSSQNHTQNISVKSGPAHEPAMNQQSDILTQLPNTGYLHDAKSQGELTQSSKNEMHQEPNTNVKSIVDTNASIQQNNSSTTNSATNGHSITNSSQYTAQYKISNNNKTSSAITTNASVSAASTTTTTTKGGSRVYKVVKRETLQPVKREAQRWTCYDYGEVHSPNLGFVIPSVSDSRLNSYEQAQGSSIPLSLSATSVPSSAYGLQHSDSASSILRDGHYVTSVASNLAVQHSTSTSSVNYDVDGRKLSKSSKPPTENSEGSNSKVFVGSDERPGKSSSDHELAPNVMHSSGELSNAVETEEDSSSLTNVRIDNKIEAAMDLVKKHLMLAVRDEVDELKEKIVELQQEIEVMKGILTPDQLAHIQPLLNKSQSKLLQMSSSSQNQHPHAQNVGNSSAALIPHDTSMTSQQQQSSHAHTGQGHPKTAQKQANPSNAPSRSSNQATQSPQLATETKSGSVQTNQPQQAGATGRAQNFQSAPQGNPSSSQTQLAPQQTQALRQQTHQPPAPSSQPAQAPSTAHNQPNYFHHQQQQQQQVGHTQTHPTSISTSAAPVASHGQSAQHNPIRNSTQNAPVSGPAMARQQNPSAVMNSASSSAPQPAQVQATGGNAANLHTAPQTNGTQTVDVKMPQT